MWGVRGTSAVIQPVDFGNNSTAGANDTGDFGFINGSPAVLSNAGTLSSLSVFVGATGAGAHVRMALYSNNASGNPGTFIAETASVTPVAGWNTLPIAGAPAIAAGTYWIVAQTDNAGTVYRIQSGMPATNFVGWSQFAYGAFPATVTGWQKVSSQAFAMYGTMSADVPPTATATTGPPVTTATFGLNATTGANDSGDSGFLNGSPAALATGGALQSLSVYVGATPANAHIRIAVYTNNASGNPGSLLAQSASVVAVQGWNTVPVTGAYLTPGTYWILAQTDNAATVYRITSGLPASNAIGWTAQAYGAFPSTVASISKQTGSAFDMYGTVDTTATVPTATNTPTSTATATPAPPTPTATNTPNPLVAANPVLVVVNSAAPNKLGPFLTEILKAEGLNETQQIDISSVTGSFLASFDVVVLAETPLTAAQASLFNTYVSNGGSLIAMKPDAQLNATLGVSAAAGTTARATSRPTRRRPRSGHLQRHHANPRRRQQLHAERRGLSSDALLQRHNRYVVPGADDREHRQRPRGGVRVRCGEEHRLSAAGEPRLRKPGARRAARAARLGHDGELPRPREARRPAGGRGVAPAREHRHRADEEQEAAAAAVVPAWPEQGGLPPDRHQDDGAAATIEQLVTEAEAHGGRMTIYTTNGCFQCPTLNDPVTAARSTTGARAATRSACTSMTRRTLPTRRART